MEHTCRESPKKHLHFWYARLTQITPKGARNSWHIKKGGECNHLHTWRCDWQLGLDIRAESAVELFTETDIKDWRIALFCSMCSFVTASDSAQPLQFSAFVTQAHWERGQWAGTAVEPQPGPLGWPLSSHEGRLDISIQHLERRARGKTLRFSACAPCPKHFGLLCGGHGTAGPRWGGFDLIAAVGLKAQFS